VHRETNPRYHRLISLFHERTGCPVIVNTSFNVRGEPIVGSPEAAFHCFMAPESRRWLSGTAFCEKRTRIPVSS